MYQHNVSAQSIRTKCPHNVSAQRISTTYQHNVPAQYPDFLSQNHRHWVAMERFRFANAKLKGRNTIPNVLVF
jgi:hypothetical protein